MEARLHLNLTGLRPLVMHNERLSNPLDPHTRRVRSLATKRTKTDDDVMELMFAEARGGMYETDDGYLGLPYQNVWACLHESARAYKLGRDIERGLMQEDGVVPLKLDDELLQCDKYLQEDDYSIYFASVGVGSRRVMRSRPRVRAGWTAELIFDLTTDVLQEDRIAPVIERAGRLVGLCERRPMFGTFSAEWEIVA